MLIEDSGCIDAAGRLVERLVVRLLRRTAGRDFGVADFGRDVVALGLAAVRGFAADVAALLGLAAVPRLAAARGLAVDAELRDRLVLVLVAVAAGLAAVDRDELRELDALRVLGRVEAVARDAGLRRAAVLGFAAARRAVLVREVLRVVRELPDAVVLADDMLFAAAVRALAAVVMALVAVFIDCMADDIVFADAVALVAAAVILVAADVTLVAAEETVFAAAVGVAELRLAVVRRAGLRRAVLRRAALLRVVRALEPEREAVERDAVDRAAELRVDRAALLRVDLAAVLRAGLAAVLRAALGFALEVLELVVDFGRLAVPLDALRLTDLLRAVLAELRRVAARVVD
jgi:hypothetical protein